MTAADPERGSVRSKIVSLALLLAATPAPAQELAARGHALLSEMCASCHAIGTSDASAHPAAPPFRIISRRLDIDALYEKLREGLSSGHADMPTFRFTREDARAVRAYLRTIEE
jgi:mono/diheme cytochrome c family protein